MSRGARPYSVLRGGTTTPFTSGAEAWFWTINALMARRAGARIQAGRGDVQRPCEPDDTLRELDRLYRARRIDLEHARVLRVYGERGMQPDETALMERADARTWREATARLEAALRRKGIVSNHLPAETAQ